MAGVIWPSAEYADNLTVINMRPEVGGPPPTGIVPPLNDADLQTRARDVAQFLGIDPDQLASQALRAAGDNGARDALVSTLQNATASRREALADEQTKAEYDAAFSDTGSHLFFTRANTTAMWIRIKPSLTQVLMSGSHLRLATSPPFASCTAVRPTNGTGFDRRTAAVRRQGVAAGR
jgi:hypothetical protein